MGLHIEIHGEADRAGTADRPSVLLSSGLGGSANFWKPQIADLVGAGWRVIAYDQDGTGRSPSTLPGHYSIGHMARDVVDVLDTTATASCHLVGHALGGLVGLQLALDAPGRVASLALVNAWSRPNSHSARCFDARLGLLQAFGAAAYVEAQPIFLYPAAWAEANAGLVEAEVRHAIEHFPGEHNMRARIAALRAFDIDARLHEIGAPALVATAMDDVLVPWTMSRRLADGLPHAEFDCVPYGGHAHSVTEPAAFNRALLAFLASLTPTSRPTA